jgi:hypothetical protein
MDSRALVAFSNSPRKLDIMFWLTYRLHSLKDTRMFPWEALQGQFGDGFTRLVDFRKAFIRDLAHIGEVFPNLRYSLTPRGMMLEATGPQVLAIPQTTRAKSLK